jgi:hypothetical protein
VASFSGIDNEQATAGYVHGGVYRSLREGVRGAAQATLAAHPTVRAASRYPPTRALQRPVRPGHLEPVAQLLLGRSGYSPRWW